LTGGSFERDPPVAGVEDPDPEPLELDGAEPLLRPDGFAAEPPVGATAAGVGSDSALGGSTPEAEAPAAAEEPEEEPEEEEEEARPEEADDGPRISFRCGRAAAASA